MIRGTPATCPNCGTRKIRPSRARNVIEHFRTFFGVYSLRCTRCDTRFKERIWHFGDIKFARCPRCYRLDLTTWQEAHYHPPMGVVLLLRFGAKPYRCEACRCNFASYRAMRQRFSLQRNQKSPVDPARNISESETH